MPGGMEAFVTLYAALGAAPAAVLDEVILQKFPSHGDVGPSFQSAITADGSAVLTRIGQRMFDLTRGRLDEVRVPATNVVVEAGGFHRLFGVFSIERLGNATMSLAIGQAALDRSRAYVETREQFGRPLVEFQNVQMMMATMAMQVEAARLLIYRAAVNGGRGLPVPFEVSVAKCFANEMGKQVSDMAMQLHGGNGYSEEYDLERLHRDSHGWAIAGGTPAIQRVRIASELFGRNFNQRPPEAIAQ